ncbi:hypothetical protein OCAR_4471 [Afipia carboxidovorans OM5]|nr:hypothetical protein OCAR_4471 [Afipia carboxidovorans OM5]
MVCERGPARPSTDDAVISVPVCSVKQLDLKDLQAGLSSNDGWD